jgi:hypothetical protein
MPSDAEMLEHVLVRAKDRKSSKKCRDGKCEVPKPCEVDCCIPDCNPECCTPAFQRLDKLRNLWMLTQYSPTLGSVVFVPTNINVVSTTTALGTNPAVVGAAVSAVGTASLTTSSVPITQEASNWVSTVYNRAGQLITTASPLVGANSYGILELAAYTFVNEVRYLNFEECGKLDQVTGWSVDIQTGDLYFYQNLPELGLLTSDSRLDLISLAATAFTPQDKQKLSAMEPFWKLSLKAVERVRENPKTEGNICEVKDKCGNRFLIAVNRVNGQSDTSSVCAYNSQYSIVAVKLC